MQKWDYYVIGAQYSERYSVAGKTYKNGWYFEYKGENHFMSDLYGVIRELGAQGWELVCALTPVAAYNLFFKRPAD